MRHLRDALARLADVTGLWGVLPGRVQGWLCDCSVCRGEESLKSIRRNADTEGSSTATN